MSGIATITGLCALAYLVVVAVALTGFRLRNLDRESAWRAIGLTAYYVLAWVPFQVLKWACIVSGYIILACVMMVFPPRRRYYRWR